jgi:lactoylglutathione lyase
MRRRMQLGYTILYVDDVRRSVVFYQQAFGLTAKLVHESGEFAEMATGSTSLAFSSRALMRQLGKTPTAPDAKAPCFEIAFTTKDVAAGVEQAVAAGATLLQAPQEMPWGQTVAYVADPDGFMVEVCTPMEADHP